MIKCRYRRQTGNIYTDHYDLLIPENGLSSRRRRELRIRNCFDLKTGHGVDRNRIFSNESKGENSGQYRDQVLKFKFFLWPNFRFEDLACMNRY